MKKIIQKISAVLQVVLLAPVKLPGKALNIIKYIALGLGVVETVMDDKGKKDAQIVPPDEASKGRIKEQFAHSDLEDQSKGKVLDKSVVKDDLFKEDFNKRKEVRDEIE